MRSPFEGSTRAILPSLTRIFSTVGHFAIDEEGRLMDLKLKAKPLTTAGFLLVSVGVGDVN